MVMHMRRVIATTTDLIRSTNPAYLYAATIAAAALAIAAIITFHDIMRVVAALPAAMLGVVG